MNPSERWRIPGADGDEIDIGICLGNCLHKSSQGTLKKVNAHQVWMSTKTVHDILYKIYCISYTVNLFTIINMGPIEFQLDIKIFP